MAFLIDNDLVSLSHISAKGFQRILLKLMEIHFKWKYILNVNTFQILMEIHFQVDEAHVFTSETDCNYLKKNPIWPKENIFVNVFLNSLQKSCKDGYLLLQDKFSMMLFWLNWFPTELYFSKIYSTSPKVSPTLLRCSVSWLTRVAFPPRPEMVRHRLPKVFHAKLITF